MPTVRNFQPSLHGLHFGNMFASIPYNFRILGVPVRVGRASDGMCGGMVYTVCDLFEMGILPDQGTIAPSSGALFDYLSNRLLDSFHLPIGPLRYLFLMSPLQPDQDTWLLPGRGTVLAKEWAKVKRDIDQNRLAPIGLITQKNTFDTRKLGLNHQVLVYGYEQQGYQVRLNIYDPNLPGDDTITLSFDLTQPGWGVNPQYFSARWTTPLMPVNCFFRIGYAFKRPPENLQAWSIPVVAGESTPQFCIGVNQDGRLELFFIGRDGLVYHSWQPVWAWNRFDFPKALQIEVERLEDGCLQLTVLGADGAWYRARQQAPNSGWEAVQRLDKAPAAKGEASQSSSFDPAQLPSAIRQSLPLPMVGVRQVTDAEGGQHWFVLAADHRIYYQPIPSAGQADRELPR